MARAFLPLGAALVAAGLACRSGPAPASRTASAAAAPASEPARAIPTARYLTGFGAQYVAPSESVALARVRGLSPIPSGPSVARADVERWVVPPAGSTPTPRIAVSVPSGALTVSDTPVLLFLASPETAGSPLRPLVGVAHGDAAMLDTIAEWVAVEREVALLPSPEERLAAMKSRLLAAVRSEQPAMRTLAVRELGRWAASTRDSYFDASDPARMEGTAAALRDRDRETSVTLLALAERIRAGIR